MARIIGNGEDNAMYAPAYRLSVPAGERLPELLFNQDKGGTYKSCGMVTKKNIYGLHTFLNTEVFALMSILCNIYHSRNNTIDQEMIRNKNTVRGIFSCDLVNYKFSLNEVYKRYAMRKNYLGGADAGEFNFWYLEHDEIDKWKSWLLELGWMRCVRDALWIMDKTDDGKWFLQLKHNKLTLALIQTMNSLYDIISVIDGIANWERWVDYEKNGRSRFRPC